MHPPAGQQAEVSRLEEEAAAATAAAPKSKASATPRSPRCMDTPTAVYTALSATADSLRGL